MNEFELTILDFIQEHIANKFFDLIMPFITVLGNAGILWIVTAIILLIIPKTRKYGLVMAVSLIIEATICNLMLKPLVARIRPYDVKPMVDLLVAKPKDFSFPSGHSGASFAAAAALLFSKNKCWIPAMIVATAIAFSRLYLYVHYPTDVLTGILLGFLSAFVTSFVINKLMDKNKKKVKDDIS